MKLTREAPWAQQHPDIMGPNSSVFYFGPAHTPGHLAFGNTMPQPMTNYRRQRRDSSTFVVLIPCHLIHLQTGEVALGIFVLKVVPSLNGGLLHIGWRSVENTLVKYSRLTRSLTYLLLVCGYTGHNNSCLGESTA